MFFKAFEPSNDEETAELGRLALRVAASKMKRSEREVDNRIGKFGWGKIEVGFFL